MLGNEPSTAPVQDERLYQCRDDVRPIIRQTFKVAVPFGLVTTGVYLVGAVQVPLLGAILGPAFVTAIYTALRISQALNGAVLQLVNANLPSFTRECTQGHRKDARHRMISIMTLGAMLQVAASVFIYFTSPEVVLRWIGPENYIDGPVLAFFTCELSGHMCRRVACPVRAGQRPKPICDLDHPSWVTDCFRDGVALPKNRTAGRAAGGPDRGRTHEHVAEPA